MARRWYDGIELEELQRSHKDFQYVHTKMHKTIGHGDVLNYDIRKVFRINNKYTWPRYVKRRAQICRDMGGQRVTERRLFHGSPNAETIANEGFDRGFAKSSGMFGAGVYFAEHSSKSNNYSFGCLQPCPRHSTGNCSSCVRKMLICKVAIGKLYETTFSTTSSLPKGYHSVRGNAGMRLAFPEYVIYNDDQVYPSYLIEYTANYKDGCSLM
ncbi:poly [ADP-ribose] polymerase tankyrase-2-like [Neocloeon triangulifer]|uniref:poly [ADP-ribose] polymerase tankyrase-2-like n=1 Tax=Neocloeon triangulifer TaxID=2078957 RepID=UPI00286FA5D0|nr:poly [ADP-ribose] polymerase tankyrase-2-like [Neocloeon triangulifer]